MTESNGISGSPVLSSWMPPDLEPRHLEMMGWVVRGPQPLPDRAADTEPPPARSLPVRRGKRWLVVVTRGEARREFAIYRQREPRKGELVLLLQPHFLEPLALFYTIEVRAADDADHWADGTTTKLCEDRAPARETRK